MKKFAKIMCLLMILIMAISVNAYATENNIDAKSHNKNYQQAHDFCKILHSFFSLSIFNLIIVPSKVTVNEGY